jgi:elongation factor Ts
MMMMIRPCARYPRWITLQLPVPVLQQQQQHPQRVALRSGTECYTTAAKTSARCSSSLFQPQQLQQQQQQQQQQQRWYCCSTPNRSNIRMVRWYNHTPTALQSMNAMRFTCRTHSTTTTTTAASTKFNVMAVVKELRNRTGAPIVDCKKAIQEVQKAIPPVVDASDTTTSTTTDHATDEIVRLALDWLRIHSTAKTTSKVAGRETTQGLVGLHIQETSETHNAALVKVASETDFAALSPTFVQLVQTIVHTTLLPFNENPSSSTTTSAEWLQQPAATASDNRNSPKTVQDCINEAMVSIRENLDITDAIHLPNVRTQRHINETNGTYVGYVHNKVDTTTSSETVSSSVMVGTAAAIVLLVPTNTTSTTTSTSKSPAPPNKEGVQQIGKLLAMHIVAAQPQYMSISDVPAYVVEEKRNEVHEQFFQMQDVTYIHQPESVQIQMVNQKLQTHYYEKVCLLEQSHMMVDTHPNIGTYLQDQQLTLQRYEYRAI